MVLWVIFVVMAAVAAIALLRPLMSKQGETLKRSEYEAAIYREQLQSLQSEIDTGAMAPAEAHSARAEIGRRLLATEGAKNHNLPSEADSQIEPPAARGRGLQAASLVVMIFVPALSLGLYSTMGSPNLPSVPAASRAEVAGTSQSIQQLIARVEEHLRANPDDARGWEVLGPAMMRLGRHDAAAKAFRRIIELKGPTAKRLAILGEALTFAESGMVTAEARKVFAEAVELDAALPDPQYYLGLASLQDRDIDGAVSVWKKLLAASPADAPWRNEVEIQIASALGLPPPPAPGSSSVAGSGQAPSGPGAAEIAAADQMSAADRAAMIADMVARLNERLSQNGGSAEEWLRLANAYRVMGEAEKRDDVIARARVDLGKDPDALDQFEAGIAASDKG
ncbi:Cytochrome c heme lyase subunit CcmH [hydrothermal vent metagenome]|uniref:Cytochrome c heme lyase subunit CcmH n=1 Tax=hydrothermal vent metagenome TaxID=652676 RepID=A0A3B0UF09_9ZZZZ